MNDTTKENKPEPKDWVCGCGAKVSEGTYACLKCNTKNPANNSDSSDEWFCISCGHRNPAEKNTCENCTPS